MKIRRGHKGKMSAELEEEEQVSGDLHSDISIETDREGTGTYAPQYLNTKLMVWMLHLPVYNYTKN